MGESSSKILNQIKSTANKIVKDDKSKVTHKVNNKDGGEK